MIRSATRLMTSNSSEEKNLGAYGPVGCAAAAGGWTCWPYNSSAEKGKAQVVPIAPMIFNDSRLEAIYISPFRNRPEMCSAQRAARAIMVWVGFFSEADGKTLPSTTYRFGTSCERQSAFKSDVFG